MLRSTTSVPRIGLGLALILLGLLFFVAKPNKTLRSSETFENEPVKVEMEIIEPDDLEKIPRQIIIPNLTVDLAIQKAEVVNGYWEVFSDTAGWGIGSGLPGEKGNQVVFAHAKEGLFKPLRSIKVGDNIYILNETGWFLYHVAEIKEVSPRQTDVIRPTEEEILTLYTCSGYSDEKRLIVIAKPATL